MDLVWIVLSCQATQAERPDSLAQSKPNPHTVLLHSAQQILSDGGMNHLNFLCKIIYGNIDLASNSGPFFPSRLFAKRDLWLFYVLICYR